MKIRNIILVVIMGLFLLSFGFIGEKNSPGNYSRVKIYLNSENDLLILQNNGITVDEYWGSIKTGIEIEINKEEVQRLKYTGLRYEILIPDLDEYYLNRPAPTETELLASKIIMAKDGIKGYTLGTMGGYHKYTEIISVLDTLRLLYPNLITAKQIIGSSQESRTIYAVKISDNPDVDESAFEPAVHFDGLHHAREPMSMEVQLYFMWYLLENYSTNLEVQNLVDNREIFFVPIVNPDGYVYNQTNNPNGGGSWRKNRRNSGSCFGVDLNRNYSYGWGVGSGSSSDPCSDTYRGPSAFSEPEAQAVRDFILAKHPKIAMSLHSAAGYNLNPYSYCDTVVCFDVYQDFSSEFGETNQFLYGNVMEMLSYYSAGTTRDYMHVNGTFGWTSEMEGSSFWPSSSQIIPMCSRFLPTMKLVTYFGGGYAKMQNFSVEGKGWASKGDTLQLYLALRNKGLGLSSKNVVVELTSTFSGLTPLVSTVDYDSIQTRQMKVNTGNPFKFIVPATANIADNMKFIASVKQENAVVSQDTFYITVGKIDTLFADDAENGMGNWTTTSNKLLWDTSYVSSWTGSKSFADSRYGNSKNSTQSYFNLTPSFNLAGKINPRLEYAVKFATETGYDYVRIQISTNNGSTWTSIASRYTTTFSSQPSYIGVKYWVYDQINLSPYIGQTIKLRFYLYTDAGTPGDGIYIDNFRIVEYKDTLTNISNTGSTVPQTYSLYQNYPNPFNPITTIKFDLPKNTFITLRIYDILGRNIKTLVNEHLNAGSYSLDFDASGLASGSYFYRIETPDYTDIKKMFLVK
ncbi:MAG: T9SS type A sorting domain-containing protein [Ignavibacteria bacterium]|nr:T9SS type A sorting domain-containing protein [Ignavibacteria bacterium]